MLRFFKNLFSRSEAPLAGVAERLPAPPALETAPPRLASTIQPTHPGLTSPPPTEAGHPSNENLSVARVVTIPIQAILPGVDESLRKELSLYSTKEVAVPLSRIKSQLMTGSVVLPLGELRRFSASTLRNMAAQDDVPVPLPLGEILKQVGTEHYGRRSDQRKINIPDDVVGLFGKDGRTVNIAAPPAKRTAAAAPPSAPSTVLSSRAAPAKPMAAPAPSKLVSGATLPPPSNPKPAVSMPAARAPLPPVHAATVVTPRPSPGLAAGALPKPAPVSPVPVTAKATVPHKPSVTPPSSATDESAASLLLPLTEISPNWPTLIRNEIVTLKLEQASVALPFQVAEQALKSGVIQFNWMQVFHWLQPASPVGPTAETGAMMVELPLKIVAPMFMARVQKTAPARPSAAVEDIPDVFGRNGKSGWSLASQSNTTSAPPLATPGSGARPTLPARATPGASASPPAAAAHSPEPAIDLNAVMGPPGRRLSARDIVSNTGKLPGAMGALLAMSDGLLVTSAVPAKIKSEMLSAFLPQMFGRMSQYAREIGMGTVSSLSFTLEDGVWQVLRQSNVFLAVLCRPDQALPEGPLAAIAAELNKQKQ